MKEFLLPLKNKDFDGLNFYRNEDDNIEINGFGYKNPGEKVGGTDLGDFYDIIIFSEDGPPKMPERFQAILISPLDYISRMIDDGFLGIVAKVTTTSDTIMDEAFEQMCSKAAKYIKYYEEYENDE